MYNVPIRAQTQTTQSGVKRIKPTNDEATKSPKSLLRLA